MSYVVFEINCVFSSVWCNNFDVLLCVTLYDYLVKKISKGGTVQNCVHEILQHENLSFIMKISGFMVC